VAQVALEADVQTVPRGRQRDLRGYAIDLVANSVDDIGMA